jgi:sugar O-acyltransferase (sialic acid O-acetyltransferase NeuD family)
MANNGIVLIGDGGHARAVRDVIESLNGYSISLGGRPEIAMTIKDSREISKDGRKALGNQYKNFVLGVGQIKSAQDRIDIVEQFPGVQWPTIISPHAYVSPKAAIGQGVVIMHNAVVNAGALVDDFCIVNTGAIVEHDADVGEFCHISTNAVVNGGASVGRCSFIGSGAVVLNQIRIGADVILGAGSIACTDIDKPGIYRGNPAGRIK